MVSRAFSSAAQLSVFERAPSSAQQPFFPAQLAQLREKSLPAQLSYFFQNLQLCLELNSGVFLRARRGRADYARERSQERALLRAALLRWVPRSTLPDTCSVFENRVVKILNVPLSQWKTGIFRASQSVAPSTIVPKNILKICARARENVLRCARARTLTREFRVFWNYAV